MGHSTSIIACGRGKVSVTCSSSRSWNTKSSVSLKKNGKPHTTYAHDHKALPRDLGSWNKPNPYRLAFSTECIKRESHVVIFRSCPYYPVCDPCPRTTCRCDPFSPLPDACTVISKNKKKRCMHRSGVPFFFEASIAHTHDTWIYATQKRAWIRRKNHANVPSWLEQLPSDHQFSRTSAVGIRLAVKARILMLHSASNSSSSNQPTTTLILYYMTCYWFVQKKTNTILKDVKNPYLQKFI